jgi:hypothetical protein
MLRVQVVGVNFDFIKEFLEDFKGDFMRLIVPSLSLFITHKEVNPHRILNLHPTSLVECMHI